MCSLGPAGRAVLAGWIRAHPTPDYWRPPSASLERAALSPQVRQPFELPASMAQEIEKNINVRWYNEKTNEFSWIDPLYHTPWRQLKDEETAKP